MVYEIDNEYSWDGMTSDYYYLSHHGIKGQKWGIRRYQNPDGTLTAEGRERYGLKPTYFNSVPRGMLNDPLRMTKLGGHRQRRLEKKADKARAEGKDKRAEKLAKKAEAQSAANENRNAWDTRQKSGRLVASTGTKNTLGVLSSLQQVPRNPSAYLDAFMQVMNGSISNGALQELANVAVGFNPAALAINLVANNAVSTPNYRHARARGSGVVRSFLESGAGLEPVGSVLRYVGDKKAYGALTWFS